MLEARSPEAQPELLGLAALDLVAEQPIQKLGVPELVVHGLLLAEVESLEDPAEPELLEQRDQVINEAHGRPPRRRS